MKKILIVAGDSSTGSQFQETLSLAGFYTAVVEGVRAMVDFCQQHDPDLCLIDLDIGGDDLWPSIQGLKSLRNLANLPLLGFSNARSSETFQKAKEHGFGGLIPKNSSPENFLNSVHYLAMESAQNQETDTTPSSLPRLLELSSEVATVTDRLKGNVGEFGAEGLELFGYIENSSVQISDKLASISETDLKDRELRHDFRNMIGSVTGFSELILMEPNLSVVSHKGLTRLRECSREFVELLDHQKEGAL